MREHEEECSHFIRNFRATGSRGASRHSAGMLTDPLVQGVFLALFMTILSSCVPSPKFSEDQWREETARPDPSLLYAPHYRDGRYFNSWHETDRGGFKRFLQWRFSPSQKYTQEEEEYMPAVIPDLKRRMDSMQGRDFIAWVGHGTFLLRLNGKTWLTDPMLSEKALLPKRRTPPALSVQDLKQLGDDLNVVVTHNHYDHFDKATIAGLPADASVFAPLGLKKHIVSMNSRLNKANVREMDWWETLELGEGVKLVCLPAQHWSMRIGQWRNRTLWASFLLITPKATIYVGGDSGYFIGYREIGRRFPGIDYALLPLTAYHPRWFMHEAHMNAEEVLRAFEDLGARFLIPTQWGTFRLGNEPIGYPAMDLKRATQVKNVDPSRVILMDIGELRLLATRAG